MTKRHSIKKVKWIVVHYSASPIENDTPASVIDAGHRAKGYAGMGYHFYIRKDGDVELGRPVDATMFTQGAHVLGHNDVSIGICYEGGVHAADPNKGYDSRTLAQTQTLIRLLDHLTTLCPGAKVVGHKDMPGAKTQCPGFDVAAWWAEVLSERFGPAVSAPVIVHLPPERPVPAPAPVAKRPGIIPEPAVLIQIAAALFKLFRKAKR